VSALSALAGDSDESWPVDESTPAYQGSLIEVRRDIVRGPDGDRFERDVVLHKGAVVIAALDDGDRVLVVSQYRHPTGRRLVELPAGLLDKPGEDPLEAAKRELAEEGRTEADRWTPLFTLLPSPGMTDERVIVYLADNVRETALPDGFVVQHEEATMTREWVRLDDLVDAILAGRIGNSATVAAVLALWTRRHRASPEQDAERS
jgi:ADP-ribose pyrophosphatase